MAPHTMITLANLYADWKETIKPLVIEACGADEPALSESWNDFTDMACKDGQITGLMYAHRPAWDDEIPSDDYEFILDAMGVSFEAARVTARSDGVDFGAGYERWTVKVARGGISFEIGYSTGKGCVGSTPANVEVFNCLLLDTACIDSDITFEEWAEDTGNDADSRKAERAFEGAQQELADLQRLFSKEELADLREIFADY